MNADRCVARAADKVQGAAGARERKLLDQIVAMHRENIDLKDQISRMGIELSDLRRKVRLAKIISKEAQR